MIMKSEIVTVNDRLAFEFVPRHANPRAIYVRFDGERIAYRESGRWIATRPEYRVRDIYDGDGIEIAFKDSLLH
jgi:hypothetical protein